MRHVEIYMTKRKASGLQWTCIFHFHQWQYNLFKHKRKNKAVNAELAEILTVLKNNGETLNNDFKIDRKKDGTYSFNVSGSSLNRFRADVFGKSSADDLEYDKDTGIDEANATAEQIMEYLMGKITLASVRNTMGIWHTVSSLSVMPCLETASQDTKK